MTFQISASPNTAWPVSVFYSMSGTALKGADYTLDPASDPTYPQLTIPVGSDSGIIAMTILVDHVREGNETATMTLQSGPYYSFAPAAGKKKKKAKAPSATVTLIDGP